MLRKLKLLTTATFVFGLCLSTAFGASESRFGASEARRIEVQPLRPSTAPSSSDSEADLAAAAADRPATAPGAFYGEMVSGVPEDRMKKIDLYSLGFKVRRKRFSIETFTLPPEEDEEQDNQKPHKIKSVGLNAGCGNGGQTPLDF